MSDLFRKWWINDGGSEQWARAVDVDILSAIEMVFNSGVKSLRDLQDEMDKTDPHL